MIFDRYDAIALGVFAAGIALFVGVVIPNIEVSIAAFDHLFGGI